MSNNYRHLRSTTGVKVVANPVELNVMNVVCNNNKRKLNKLDKKKIEKDARSKMRKKIRGTGGSENISNGASLPEDIILDILPMLPVKSLLRFRCVCKSWNKLFKTTSFAKLQLDYSLKNRNNGILIDSVTKICHLDYDSLTSDTSKSDNKLVHMAYPLEYKKQEILGSCNGLVCYRSLEIIIFWNPYTTVYKKTSPPPDPRSGKRPWGWYRYGFCYDSTTEDYKLVLYRCSVYIHIYVYSLKLDSWKTITTTNIHSVWPSGELVFFKRFFNWVAKYNGHRRGMSCLDTANETLKHIPLPKKFLDAYKQPQACLLGGCVCVIGSDDERNIREVWTMKDYGVAKSWTKMFTIDNMKLSGIQHLNLKQSFKDDAILVHHYGTSTFLYDLKHEVARELKITWNAPGLFRTWDFLESLVTPNLGT